MQKHIRQTMATIAHRARARADACHEPRAAALVLPKLDESIVELLQNEGNATWVSEGIPACGDIGPMGLIILGSHLGELFGNGNRNEMDWKADRRWEQALERCGFTLAFSDDHSVCGGCSRAIPTQPQDWSDYRHYMILHCDIICEECVAADPADAARDIFESRESDGISTEAYHIKALVAAHPGSYAVFAVSAWAKDPRKSELPRRTLVAPDGDRWLVLTGKGRAKALKKALQPHATAYSPIVRLSADDLA